MAGIKTDEYWFASSLYKRGALASEIIISVMLHAMNEQTGKECINGEVPDNLAVVYLSD